MARPADIDQSGKVVIPPTLPAWGNSGSEFHDGLLEIGVSDGVYVDRPEKPSSRRGASSAVGTFPRPRRGHEGRRETRGYIDTSGAFAISPRFETYPNGYVYPFSDGLAMIDVRGKFGFIDHTGEFVIEPQFPTPPALAKAWLEWLPRGLASISRMVPVECSIPASSVVVASITRRASSHSPTKQVESLQRTASTLLVTFPKDLLPFGPGACGHS